MSFQKYKNDKFYKAVADHLGIKFDSQSDFNKITKYAKTQGVSGINSQNDLHKIFGTGKYNNTKDGVLDGLDSNKGNDYQLKDLYSKGKDAVKDFKKNKAVQSVVDMSNVDVDSKAAGGVRMKGIGSVRKAMQRDGIKAAFNRSGKRLKKINETFN